MSRRWMVRLIALSCLPLLYACASAEATKQRHLKAGDELVQQQRYAEAIVEYRNAFEADQRFAEAR